jgi:hypothetical protein
MTMPPHRHVEPPKELEAASSPRKQKEALLTMFKDTEGLSSQSDAVRRPQFWRAARSARLRYRTRHRSRACSERTANNTQPLAPATARLATSAGLRRRRPGRRRQRHAGSGCS